MSHFSFLVNSILGIGWLVCLVVFWVQSFCSPCGGKRKCDRLSVPISVVPVRVVHKGAYNNECE